MAWSPDGRQIAFVRTWRRDARSLAVIPALGGSERIVAEATSFGWDFGSPDGKWLVAACRDFRLTARLPCSAVSGHGRDDGSSPAARRTSWACATSRPPSPDG
ncbi:MAG: PD40 domain-containing protein [Holophagales bacterium]|nr:PD40 domain-containing protein [Holophagales bacterium]